MVTLTSADNALKSVYLEVLQNQLNTGVNPFLAKIKNSTKDVWGKEVVKLAPFGINGGISAGTETGDLPDATGNNYLKFVSTLKNLYGSISISDKAIRASANNTGAFVNLLNDEMEGLLKAATFNFGRMLYGDGSGKLGTLSAVDTTNLYFTTNNIQNFIEGQVVDLVNTNGTETVHVKAVDRSTGKVYVTESAFTGTYASGGSFVATDAYASDSKDNELTGLGKIFDTSASIYGVTRTNLFGLLPEIDSSTTTLTEVAMQKLIDDSQLKCGTTIDFIACSPAVRRKYQGVLATNKQLVNTIDLAGGVKALSFNGIPVVADRFCPAKTMFMLDSKTFCIHQLCDWRWLEGDNGKILKQNAGKATYNATLVKYAEMICDVPGGQAKFSNITE